MTRFQGQMLTIHGKSDGDSKARDWRIRGWLWRLWTNCRQDSRRRILTHRQSVRLCPSALCLCARVCCTTCAMIAVIFHKHILIIGGFLFGKVFDIRLCMFPSCSHCFTGLRTYFVFSVAQLLPMLVNFFGFNGNFNGKMTKIKKMAKNHFSGVQNGSQSV